MHEPTYKRYGKQLKNIAINVYTLTAKCDYVGIGERSAKTLALSTLKRVTYRSQYK